MHTTVVLMETLSMEDLISIHNAALYDPSLRRCGSAAVITQAEVMGQAFQELRRRHDVALADLAIARGETLYAA